MGKQQLSTPGWSQQQFLPHQFKAISPCSTTAHSYTKSLSSSSRVCKKNPIIGIFKNIISALQLSAWGTFNHCSLPSTPGSLWTQRDRFAVLYLWEHRIPWKGGQIWSRAGKAAPPPLPVQLGQFLTTSSISHSIHRDCVNLTGRRLQQGACVFQARNFCQIPQGDSGSSSRRRC